jgi:site-specific recombinase XerD
MKPTDFSKYISDFFGKYLPGERGVSPNTVIAYKHTFILLITFMEEKRAVKMKNRTIGHITKEIVVEFLDWLQKARGSSNSTRNARLAALRAFFCFLQYHAVEHSHESQRILIAKSDIAPMQLIVHLLPIDARAFHRYPATTILYKCITQFI